MGVDLYLGWDLGDNSVGFEPPTDHDIKVFVFAATGVAVEQRDLDLYRAFRAVQGLTSCTRRFDDVGMEIHRALRQDDTMYAIHRCIGGSLGRAYAFQGCMSLVTYDPNGSSRDKREIAMVLSRVGLNPKAARLVDEIYWS